MGFGILCRCSLISNLYFLTWELTESFNDYLKSLPKKYFQNKTIVEQMFYLVPLKVFCLALESSLNSDSHLIKNCYICFNGSSLKMMKGAFYFILKATFVLRILKLFFLTFWSCRKNSFSRKIRTISKFMTSQPC